MKNKDKERRGSELEQKWGILKYLTAEFFSEKSDNISDQRVYECRVLGQKLGYDRCPYLSFFVRRLEDKIFDSTDRRDLNTKYTIFDLRCYEMLVMQLWMQDGKDDLIGMRNNNGIPKFVEEKGSDSASGNVVLLGKMIVYHCIGLKW